MTACHYAADDPEMVCTPSAMMPVLNHDQLAHVLSCPKEPSLVGTDVSAQSQPRRGLAHTRGIVLDEYWLLPTPSRYPQLENVR